MTSPSRTSRWALAILVAASVATGLPLAFADRAEDRTVAEALLRELDQDTAHKAQTAEAVARAREALERANRMRAAGDEAHARLAEGLARHWAELGRDLVRAVDAEKKAKDTRRAAMDAGAQAERERALLEEGLARVGRLRAQIDAADREAKETHRTAATALDAGAKGGRAVKKQDNGTKPKTTPSQDGPAKRGR